MEQCDVEEELALDRMYFGACYWRVVDGKKVRVSPWEVRIRDDGTLLGADCAAKAQPDSASAGTSDQLSEGQK